MPTRDRRRARMQKRKNSTEEEQRPLYNEAGLRHNERVIRQTMERDRQSQPQRFRREKHQQIPIAPKGKEELQEMPYVNQEGIEHNKRVVEMNRQKDKEERMTDAQRKEIERRKSVLQHIVDFLNTKAHKE